MTTTVKTGLDSTSEALLNEVSQLVFESALMAYLVDKTDDEADTFEAFIKARGEDENLVDELCATYPEFDTVLKAEIKVFMAKNEKASSY